MSSNAGATCAISFSRADRITANPNACGAFNTTEPPRFVDPASDNFQLRQASTLVDAGNPDSPPVDALAFNGLPRALPGNCEPGGDAIRDMGAYELKRTKKKRKQPTR